MRWHPPPPPRPPHLDFMAPLFFHTLVFSSHESKGTSPRPTLSERKASADRFVISLQDNPAYAMVVFSLIALFLSAKILTLAGIVDAYAIPAGLVVAVIAGVWAKRFLSAPQVTERSMLVRNTMLCSVPFAVGMSLTGLFLEPLDGTFTKVLCSCLGGGLLAFGTPRAISDAHAKPKAQ